MTCYHPIPARQESPGEPVQLQPPIGTANLAVPCGKCIGCRTARATQWANRCIHEASLSDHNVFLTLTYDDENLPEEGHLQPADLRNFLKRLRIHAHRHSSSLNRDRRRGIRFFACGEYGSETQRPHYHAILFNCGFPDRDTSRIGTSKNGDPLYESEILHGLWKLGHHQIGTANARSAAYTAQYALKRYTVANWQYDHTAKGETNYYGEWRPAPFLRTSKGIGKDWLAQYRDDVRKGFLVHEGRKYTIPRYYQNKLKEQQTHIWEESQYRQQKHRLESPLSDKNTPARLHDEEIIHTQRKQLTEHRDLIKT